MKLFNYRKFYKKDSLSINDVGDNPLEFFRRWFEDADNSDEIIESNAMTLSTVENNAPSSRVVLLNSSNYYFNYDISMVNFNKKQKL